jgi:hypothetical protein
MDQLRSTTPTKQREKRLSMTLFILVLDMAINNARSIKSKLELGSDTDGDVVSFKRRLCEQLVLPLLCKKDEQKQLQEQRDRPRKKYK